MVPRILSKVLSMPGSMTSRKIMSKCCLEILNSASSPEEANSGEMPYGCSLFCRKVRISGLSSTASTRNCCSSWRGVGTAIGATGAMGIGGAMGCMAIVGTVIVIGALGGGTIGASAMRAAAAAAEGREAASDGGFGTTRRLVRVAEVGATAADSADGDSGVTPLGISAAADARILSDAVRSGTGLSFGILSLRILSTARSVTGFSLIDLSSAGTTLGCSVMLGSTVAAGAAAVMVAPDMEVLAAVFAVIE